MNNFLSTGLFLLNVINPVQSTPVYAQTEPIPIPIETIEQRIDRVAVSHSIATTTLYNLVWGESTLNPLSVGDMSIICPVGVNKGKPVRAKGLVQITDCYFPEITDKQSFDPEWSLHWASDKIAKGDAWKIWTNCNCYTYAKTQISNLPAMKDIQPNTPYPVVGGLVILYYGKVKHISVITKVTEFGYEVKDTNYEPCKFTKRFIKNTDKNIDGFWRANQ